MNRTTTSSDPPGGRARRYLPDGPRTRRRRRIDDLLRLVAWVPLLVLVAVVATRVVGYDDHVVAVVAHAVLPWVLLAAWPAAMAAFLCRQAALGGVAIVLVVTHVAWLSPLVRPAPTAPAPGGVSFRVVTLNLFAPNPQTVAVARRLRSIGADIVFFQELTPRHHRRLAASGALDRFSHAVAFPQLSSRGSAIYSRLPLDETEVTLVSGAPMTSAVVTVAGARVALLNVHTTSPLTGVSEWNTELRGLAAKAAAETRPMVMAGDFNATEHHRGLRRILAAGLDDAHVRAGRPWATTWPVQLRRIPQLVRLDRVLVSPAVGVRRVREVTVAGSDHRAVVADLIAPARAGNAA